MKAYLRSARIAPKKANIIAKMVRGMTVSTAMEALANTHKKGARMVEELLKSAVANAEHNDKQDSSKLVIKTIVVNQSMGYRRGVPMARGRMRPMTKFLSHISLTLGIAGAEEKEEQMEKKEKNQKIKKNDGKMPSGASQSAKNKVQRTTEKSTKESSTETSS